MRGKILAFDTLSGEGHISGDDGHRYRFAGAEWKVPAPPSPGEPVDFEAEGKDALAVFPLTRVFVPGPKNRVSAALLAIFLGAAGIHKFYLNRNAAGLTMLAVSIAGILLAGIPSAAMALIGLVEGMLYLTRSQDEFDRHYVSGSRAWF
ncbi:TM2 domain-containing protein [Sphingomonas canadensis]|uniref:TM2 domain-containing protein n=1 Tax=Sphingomonas canadensis TaxID=1219257 RepID=A0ABW3HBL7_9SPHN|nr:TM2 domain-containing protein [Sphingomonas canadensis]MCW3838021.1 TM2 domain-containing protein [Sphingomonas canadensis]